MFASWLIFPIGNNHYGLTETFISSCLLLQVHFPLRFCLGLPVKIKNSKSVGNAIKSHDINYYTWLVYCNRVYYLPNISFLNIDKWA